MIKPPTAASQLSDQELLVEVWVVAARERESTAWLVALLAQLDSRRLYLGEGCASLFTYCTQVLHLSEHAAYGRIEAARATRKFAELLNLLIDGSITLTTVTLLAPHLTPVNHREVLEEARRKASAMSSTSSRAYVRRRPCRQRCGNFLPRTAPAIRSRCAPLNRVSSTSRCSFLLRLRYVPRPSRQSRRSVTGCSSP